MAVLGIIIVFCSSVLMCSAQVLPKETFMSAPELITSEGYPVEKHRLVTSDGYILQVHRIPAGRRVARRSSGPRAKGKKTVLIGHGLFGSSGDFIVLGPKRSLAYHLADAGYDVWMANFRGNQYTSHVNLTKDDKQFWEFSFHEHGRYDLPAIIDKVLNVTGLPKILYIGYSMGTTTFFTMMSQRPEYNDKLIAFMALAPAVYLDNIRDIVRMLLQTMDLVNMAKSQGIVALFSQRNQMANLITNLCYVKDAAQNICMQFMYSIAGEDKEEFDPDSALITLARIEPASWRQLEHFGKVALTGVFTSWEDGLWGAVKPYNFSKIKIPISLLYGKNDQLTEVSQVRRLARELKSIGVLEENVPACDWQKFNHIDFIFAKNLGNLLTKPLIKKVDYLYNKYSNE